MRVITFNTQGLEQATDKGFFDWMLEQEADVICLQDLRAKEYQLDDKRYHPEGYHSYFFDAWEDNYSGVAIYTKTMPKAIMTGLGFELCDQHGRFIQADFEQVSVASFCLPSGSTDNCAQRDKEAFMEGFSAHLNKTLRKRREFIFCGTTYIAHRTADLSNWSTGQSLSGFLPQEREWMSNITDNMGYIDAFRQINKAESQFSWRPEQKQAGKSNEGARIDYQITTANLSKIITNAYICNDTNFSKHAPLIIDYNFS